MKTALRINGELIAQKNGYLTFKVSFCPKLENKRYFIEISDYEALRTIPQNKRLWKGIDLLSKETQMDKDNIYIGLLKQANIKNEFYEVLPEEYDKFYKISREKYRTVSCLGMGKNEHDQIVFNFDCVLGSSKFTKRQFTDLLRFLSQELAYYNIDF